MTQPVSRARLLRIGRVLVGAFTLRALRTVYDDTGMICHFNAVNKRSKLGFVFKGTWSNHALQILVQHFPGYVIEAFEAKTDTSALMPYLHGRLTSKADQSVTLWAIEPATFTLIVRQVVLNVPKNN